MGSYSNTNITGIITSLSQLQCTLCPAGYFCPLGSSTYKNCPSGYTSYGGGQYCLYDSYTSSQSKTWLDAKLDCASRSNGWLVSITDANKNSIVASNTITNSIYSSSYWIGGTRTSVSSNVWTWDHGESWSYTNPNTYNNQYGLCMYMYMDPYYNYWYDDSCSNSRYYICENTNNCLAGIYKYIYYIVYYIYIYIIYI